MARKKTKADVFIIESLRFNDEDDKLFEGRFLSQILHFGGKESIYYYIRTEQELAEVLKKFEESRYRYLHLSCHGTRTSISTTLGPIPLPKLGRLLQPYVERRRLFMSTCLAVNDNLARNVIPTSGCYSIIGPTRKVNFDDAAILWASFYHLVFREDPMGMGREDIISTLQKVVNTFEVPLNYFSVSRSSKKGYRKRVVRIRRSNSKLMRARRMGS